MDPNHRLRYDSELVGFSPGEADHYISASSVLGEAEVNYQWYVQHNRFTRSCDTLSSITFTDLIATGRGGTPDPSPTRMLELRDIYMTKIQIKNPIVDADVLDAHIACVLEHGFDWSASSCLVLLVFALAAIWGNYPNDERRTVMTRDGTDLHPHQCITLAIPDYRMEESLMYVEMAQKRISAAYLDDSLQGVVCFCLFG